MKNILIKPLFFFLIFTTSGSIVSSAQNNSAALTAADSTVFSVNSSEGWQLFNSFAAFSQADSVLLELIVQHDNNVNWGEDQYIGKLKNSLLFPGNAQVVSFMLINDSYTLRIKEDGRCYLRFVSGTAPAVNPVVIPVRVYYKK